MNRMAARLRRHDLVWLSRAGWQQLKAGAHEPEVDECLDHWCEKRLPLVVGRQEPGRPELALGLPAPLDRGRRKIGLRVPVECVLYHDTFPRAAAIARLLPVALRGAWKELNASLADCGVEPRVHGSFGWEQLTGLRYLTRTSDLDLLLAVADPQAADEVAERLDAFDWDGPRIDGELIFPDGSAVPWREWLQWRRGVARSVLVKRLHGVTLEEGTTWLPSRRMVPA